MSMSATDSPQGPATESEYLGSSLHPNSPTTSSSWPLEDPYAMAPPHYMPFRSVSQVKMEPRDFQPGIWPTNASGNYFQGPSLMPYQPQVQYGFSHLNHLAAYPSHQRIMSIPQNIGNGFGSPAPNFAMPMNPYQTAHLSHQVNQGHHLPTSSLVPVQDAYFSPDRFVQNSAPQHYYHTPTVSPFPSPHQATGHHNYSHASLDRFQQQPANHLQPYHHQLIQRPESQIEKHAMAYKMNLHGLVTPPQSQNSQETKFPVTGTPSQGISHQSGEPTWMIDRTSRVGPQHDPPPSFSRGASNGPEMSTGLNADAPLVDGSPVIQVTSDDDDGESTMEEIMRAKRSTKTKKTQPRPRTVTKSRDKANIENWMALNDRAVIDLVTPVKVTKSVPMKDRVSLIKRQVTTRRRLPRKRREASPDENQKEHDRQMRAAQKIHEREFGLPVDELFEEKKNDVRARSRSENSLGEEAEVFREKEREESEIREQMKLAAEAEQAIQVAKELEELEKEELRKRKRNINMKLEEMRRDKLRQAAVDTIKKNRLEGEAKKAEREREKQKENSTQVDPEELRRLEEKKQQSKVQAASLQAPKVSYDSRDDQEAEIPRKRQRQSGSFTKNLAASDDPETQHDNAPLLMRPSDFAPRKATLLAPRNASEAFAKPVAKESSRESLVEVIFDDRRANIYARKDRKADKKPERKKFQQSNFEGDAKAALEEFRKIRAEQKQARSAEARRQRAQLKARSVNKPATPPASEEEASGSVSTDASQPASEPPSSQVKEAPRKNTENTGTARKRPGTRPTPKTRLPPKASKKPKSAPEPISQPPKRYVRPVKKYRSIVHFYPPIDREQITIEAKKRAAQKKSATGQTTRDWRGEEEKQRRREKNWGKARSKEEQRYLAEAEAAGNEVDEDQLKAHLDGYMKPRLENYRRKVEIAKAKAEAEPKASQSHQFGEKSHEFGQASHEFGVNHKFGKSSHEFGDASTDIFFCPLSEQISAANQQVPQPSTSSEFSTSAQPSSFQQLSSSSTLSTSTGFASSASLPTSVTQTQDISSSSTHATQQDSQSIMDEDRRTAQEDLEASLEALRVKRIAANPSFAAAAARKEIGNIDVEDDSDDSDESEEDPDDDDNPPQAASVQDRTEHHPSPEAPKTASTGLAENEIVSQISQPAHATVDPGQDSTISRLVTPQQAIRVPPGEPESTSVKVYQVSQSTTFDDEPEDVKIIHTFLDRQEAMDLAADMITEFRLRPVKPMCVTERYKDGLVQCTFELDESRSTTIGVKGLFVPQNSIKDFEVSQLRPLYDVRNFWIFELKIRNHAGLEDLEDIMTNGMAVKVIASYNDRDFACKKACDHMLGILKPKSSSIDQILEYDESVATELRRAAGTLEEVGELFDIMLEELPEWVEGFRGVRVWVEEHEVYGPIN